MKKNNPKIIFFGTPDFAAGILKALIENEFNIAAVVTQPDKKIGRRQEIVFPPVKKLALENKIKVFQPENLRESGIIREIREIGSDLFIVAAYGKILPKVILEIPKHGSINIHASLLPKYRGASPVQCAILSGEKKTGVTLMRMNEKMDEGDILAQKKIAIGENETADVLSAKLANLGKEMIVKLIPDWIEGNIRAAAQDQREATYCQPIKREDGKVDWNDPAEKIYRQWKAYCPWPGIFSTINIRNKSGRLKILEMEILPEAKTGEKIGKIVRYNQDIAVQAGKGLVVLKKIQLEGKKKMTVSDFTRGFLEFIGSKLE